MELAPHLPDFLDQAGLDRHVDIFQLRLELEFALLYLFADRLQPSDDRFCIFLGDNALFGQHLGVGDAAGDVLLEHDKDERRIPQLSREANAAYGH